VAGKLAARGEVDSIWIDAKAGETIIFSCAPGTSSFDPSLTLAEPSGIGSTRAPESHRL
jgi:hypothetical protein